MTEFHHWLKSKLTHGPSKNIDQKIIRMAQQRLNKKAPVPWRWLALGGSLATALVVVVLIRSTQVPLTAEVTVPREILLYQDEIEVVLEYAALSDEEWNQIIGDRS